MLGLNFSIYAPLSNMKIGLNSDVVGAVLTSSGNTRVAVLWLPHPAFGRPLTVNFYE